MSDQENKKSVSETVLSKIKEGDIKMKSKIGFAIKLILLVFGSIAVTFFALFIASFVFFILKTSRLSSLPEFGLPGLKILFFSLPWVLIFGLVALILASELFAKHFSFVYKKPILYSVLTIILIVFLGGFVVNNTGIHSNLFQKAKDGKLPIIEPFYREYVMPRLNKMHYGVVSQIENDNFKIKTPRQEELLISVSQQTRMPILEEIEEDDAVIIIGKRNGNTVKADEIRKTDRDFDIFPNPPPSQKPFNKKMK